LRGGPEGLFVYDHTVSQQGMLKILTSLKVTFTVAENYFKALKELRETHSI
jgi:hypothetical protein